MPNADMTKVIPLSDFIDADPGEREELLSLASTAKKYLSGFPWCAGILASYEGIVVAGVVGVFLFRIRPSKPEVDEWIWVVVGDLPPAYLVTNDAPTPVSALEAYVGEMRAWAKAASSGEPVDELIPVNVPATKESAAMLQSRLDFLERRLIPEYIQ